MKLHHFHLPAYEQYKTASSKMQLVDFSAFIQLYCITKAKYFGHANRRGKKVKE